MTDRHGGKRATLAGLAAMAACAAVYGVATLATLDSKGVLAILVLGRVLSGLGEGLIITGGAAWAIGRAGMGNAGRAMSWIGLAMFAGLAAGSAIGAMLDFDAIAALAMIVPLIGMAMAGKIKPAEIQAERRPIRFGAVITAIWRPGLVLALSSVGFAAVSSFVVLAYADSNWSGGGLALAAFGCGHVVARLALGGMTDRMDAGVATLATLAIETAGLALLWVAPHPLVGLLGAALAGFGFSMVYPLMALPVLRGVSAGNRGMAIGLYDAFFDVAMGLSSLLGGLIGSLFGLRSVFLFAGGAALLGLLTVLAMMRIPAAVQPSRFRD
jgi:predicted MFS family arabinose efflux permease